MSTVGKPDAAMSGWRPGHYVKPAGKTRTPAVVIVLDSETATAGKGQTETEVLRCWDAHITYRKDRKRAGETARAAGEDRWSAAVTIDQWASGTKSSWLYAHNAAFDLVTTGLAANLTALGWELSSRFGIGKSGMWCVLHKGQRERVDNSKTGPDGQPYRKHEWAHTLTIADSFSLFPRPLADLAPATGISKPPLPAADDSPQAWAARCRADVDILAALVLRLMDWWDENDLGIWGISGAALGWQSYKRHLGRDLLVIDHDPAIIAFERAAVYGGRRDIFRAGKQPAGRYAELDYEAAYPTIAASEPLPSRTSTPVTGEHRRHVMNGGQCPGMLAEVTITTDVPRWPVRAAGRVFYPVGTFRTVLAWPDIKAARDAGCLDVIHDGRLYNMNSHLKPWAEWILTLIKPPPDTPAGPVNIWAKLASRAVIGKFAQRGYRTEPWGGFPSDDWTVEPVIDMNTGMISTVTGLCGQYWISHPDQIGEHERPAVLAFVEAHVRSRLGALISGGYGSAVLQCDTDGLIADLTRLRQLAAQAGGEWKAGSWTPWNVGDVLSQWTDASWPLKIREKNLVRMIEIHGPQQVVLDGRLRAAGIPKSARQTGEGSWIARLWPGLPWQARHGPPGGYARPLQPYRIRGPYCAGWVLAGGAVRAAETIIGPDGITMLLPWEQTRWAASGAALAPSQAMWATGLWEEPDRDEPHDDKTEGTQGQPDTAAQAMAAAP